MTFSLPVCLFRQFLVIIILARIVPLASAQGVQPIYSFHGSDGCAPNTELVADAAGNLYGATASGGIGQFGVIFQLSPPVPPDTNWTETVLHKFKSGQDGASPSGKIAIDGDGNLYGTTQGGGVFQGGVAWELSPPSQPGGEWTGQVLYSFFGVNGSGPIGGLTRDVTGILYGTTFHGGANGYGTIFKLAPPLQPGLPWVESVLYSFTGGPDGSGPQGVVILDLNGNLYGTTEAGGALNGGAVFQLAPTPLSNSWTLTVLHSFKLISGNGAHPVAPLTFTDSGLLLGTTRQGGPDQLGTVFGMQPPANQGGPWGYKVLHNFLTGLDGANPVAGVMLVGNQIFGTTTTGGGTGNGTIFRLSHSGGSVIEKVVYSFVFDTGSYPAAGMLYSNGVLYGTATAGGPKNCGSVFRAANHN